MKKLLIFPLALVCLNLSAQDSLKRLKAQSVTLMPFVSVGSPQVTNLSDFEKLHPNSQILPDNLDGYSSAMGQSYPIMGGASALLGIKFLNKKGDAYKANPILRIGVSAGIGSNLYKDAYKDTRYPFDTLISVNTGERTAIDSVAYESYSMDYLTTQVRLDASLIFSTNPAKRWKFYSGFGLSVGATFTNATNISKFNYHYFAPNGDNNSAFINRNTKATEKTETTTNSSSMAFGGYVPVGVDFTISKNNDFWKKIHLFYEARGGVDMLIIPELRTYTGLYGQHGFGVKVQWE